jgi:hypothetical protein
MEGRKRILKLQKQHQKQTGSPAVPDPNSPPAVFNQEPQDYLKQTTPRSAVPSKPNPPTNNVAAPVPNPPVADPPLGTDSPHSSDHPLASGRYRLSECCILPDHEYDISGTCAENPEGKEVNDGNLIRKRVNEPTYLISGLARADVNAMMQMRSQLMIFGGGTVAAFRLGLLLLRFGLL